MESPQPSPGLRPTRNKAPEPSAALLSLQEKGLELPSHRGTPISVSPQSSLAYDPNLRVSPLSIISTPSNFRPSPVPPPVSQASQYVWRRRTSSVDSVETTVSGIINLYTNLSKHSFKSEYEEMTMNDSSDDGSIDNSLPMPMVHQPKAQAYRDTIAPLLEHQFSSSNLEVPGVLTPFPSPMSLASMPLLMHPDASPSVPSFQLTPDDSRPAIGSGPASSDRRIQLTPEMPPPPRSYSALAKDTIEAAAKTGLNTYERRVNLEVPDVRDAESWYDEPLSPISPEDLDYRNATRESQQSAVSPQSPNGKRDHFRALAFESLSPPAMNMKTSPGLRSVNVVDVEVGMVPPPLDLSRDRTQVFRTSSPAYQNSIIVRDTAKETQGTSQHEERDAKYTFGDKSDTDLEALKDSLSLSYERTSVPNQERSSWQPNLEDIDRPRSAFSDSSNSFIIYDTFSGQVKALWRDKFGKKKDRQSTSRKSTGKDRKEEKERKKSAGPTMTENATTAFTDDVETYRYPYDLKRNTDTSTLSKDDVQPAYRMKTPDSILGLDQEQQHQRPPSTAPGITRRSSEFFGQVSKFEDGQYKSSTHQHTGTDNSGFTQFRSSQDRRDLAVPAIPLTGYQKYGVEVWYESSKKKRRAGREKLRREAQKAEAVRQKAAATTAEVQAHAHCRFLTAYTDKSKPTASTLRLSGLGPGDSQPGFKRHAQAHVQAQVSHTHQLSNDSTTTDISGATSEGGDETHRWRSSQKQGRKSGASSVSRAQTPSLSYSYNNDLFEASGGRKKNGLASRLLMSSEEKRKKKVKESITIIGGARMCPGNSAGGNAEAQGLVRI